MEFGCHLILHAYARFAFHVSMELRNVQCVKNVSVGLFQKFCPFL